MEARPGTLRCDAKNGFFAGGHGDFSINARAPTTNMSTSSSATMRAKSPSRAWPWPGCAGPTATAPVGKVRKWHAGGWNEKGLGGRVTPIFPAKIDWARADADSASGAPLSSGTRTCSNM